MSCYTCTNVITFREGDFHSLPYTNLQFSGFRRAVNQSPEFIELDGGIEVVKMATQQVVKTCQHHCIYPGYFNIKFELHVFIYVQTTL